MGKPVFTPPVQTSHLYYRLTDILVWAGVTRYHKIRGLHGFEHIPQGDEPAIVVSNHQNGMMDPLISCAFVPRQIHWLTRADVFWNPVARHIMYGFNQMPIYRQRDRVADIRHRNDIIFDVCVERLQAGAVMGIFPEGNHNPFPSLRSFKGGLAALVERAVERYPDLKNIQIMPIGLDYEHYADFKRQFQARCGAPVAFADLIDEEGKLDKVAFNDRLRDSLRQLAVDIQPAEAQPILHPAVRALRTTEMTWDDWQEVPGMLDRWESRWTSDEAWRNNVTSAFEAWESAWTEAGRPGRPEAWGSDPDQARQPKAWAPVLRPLGWVANLPSWPASMLIRWWVARTVRKEEFVSTMSLGYGMLLVPLTWMLWGGIAAAFASPGWIVFAAMWSWGQVGSKFHDWVVGQNHHHRDAVDGREFWTGSQPAQVTLRNAWLGYWQALKG